MRVSGLSTIRVHRELYGEVRWGAESASMTSTRAPIYEYAVVAQAHGAVADGVESANRVERRGLQGDIGWKTARRATSTSTTFAKSSGWLNEKMRLCWYMVLPKQGRLLKWAA